MINWKLRFQNKYTLTALIAALVAFVYQVLGICGIVPPFSQDAVMTFIGFIINVLVAVGIVVDPTTDGISDSKQAQAYTSPRVDN